MVDIKNREQQALVDQYGNTLPEVKRDTDVTQLAAILQQQKGLVSGRVSAPFTQTSWIYAIVTSIAASVSEMPFGLWKSKKRSGGRYSMQNFVPVNGTKIDELLHKPNPIQRMTQFIEQWVTFLALTGNVWCLKDQENSLGVPRALLLFAGVVPVRQHPSQPPQAWRVRTSTGKVVEVPLESMIHWKLPNAYDQWMGMPPALSVQFQLDAENARIMYDRFFYENHATPDAVLTYKPGPLNRSSREMIYEAFYDQHGGPTNAGSLAVIGGDFDFKVLGLSHSQSEYISSRNFTRQEIASIYHYPVQLLNDMEGGGISKDELSVARMMKYENCVFPYARRFAEGITEELIRLFIDPTIEAHFDPDGLPVMIDFMTSKSEVVKNLCSSGVPLNDALSKVDMGIQEVDGGDLGYINKAFIPLSLAAEGSQLTSPTPPTADPNAVPAKTTAAKLTIKASYSSLKNVCARKIKRFFFELRNCSFRNLNEPEPFDLSAEIKKYQRLTDTIRLLGFKIGMDKGWGIRFNPLDEEETGKLLHSLRKVNISELNISEDFNLLSKRGNFIIHRLYEELKDSQDRELQIKESFDCLYDISRIIAYQEFVWARNLGVVMISKNYTSQNKCGNKHGRFPGDPTLSYFEVHGCRCIVQPEE